MKKLNKWAFLAIVATAWLAFDQVTKYLAVARLTNCFAAASAERLPQRIHAFVSEKDLVERGLGGRKAYAVTGFWDNRYTQNRGAAWGFLAGSGESFRVPFFHLVSIAAVIFIFGYYRKLREGQRYVQFALALILGGAVGNALDRVLRGYVIDFIDWHWFDPNWLRPSLHWPTFNVADSGISVGIVLLFLEALFVKKAGTAVAPKKA